MIWRHRCALKLQTKFVISFQRMALCLGLNSGGIYSGTPCLPLLCTLLGRCMRRSHILIDRWQEKVGCNPAMELCRSSFATLAFLANLR